MNWKKLGVKVVKRLESTFNVHIFEALIKKAFNAFGLGEIKLMEIDSINKKIKCIVLLIGEEKDIEVIVDQYKLSDTDEGLKIAIDKATVSRKWINILVQKFVIGEQFLLSDDVKDFAGILK